MNLLFGILPRPGLPSPDLEPVRDEADIGQPTAVIRGPLWVLIELLEGRIDGDALPDLRQQNKGDCLMQLSLSPGIL